MTVTIGTGPRESRAEETSLSVELFHYADRSIVRIKVSIESCVIHAALLYRWTAQGRVLRL